MSAVKNWILVNFLGTNDLNLLEITFYSMRGENLL